MFKANSMKKTFDPIPKYLTVTLMTLAIDPPATTIDAAFAVIKN